MLVLIILLQIGELSKTRLRQLPDPRDLALDLRLQRRLPPSPAPAVLLDRVRQLSIPILQSLLQHAPPKLHAGLPGLALAMLKALGSGRSLVVLNANDLGEAVFNRIPDRRAKIRKTSGRNGRSLQV